MKLTFEVKIETYCQVSGHVELLVLECENEPKGEIVEGKPSYCARQNQCGRAINCLLRALRIETRRR